MAADAVERLRQEAERLAGRPVILRAVQTPERAWRGRLSWRAGYLLIEYRDEPAGWFWDLDNLREMVEHLRQGRGNVTIYADRWVVDSPRRDEE